MIGYLPDNCQVLSRNAARQGRSLHELQQPHGVLHGGRHELAEVGGGELLHDLVADGLPHHEQEGDGHVVIALDRRIDAGQVILICTW